MKSKSSDKNGKYVEEIYDKYLKKYSPNQIAGGLIYFYQFLDIHNARMEKDNYDGLLKTIKKVFEDKKELNIIGDYFHSLVIKLINEPDDVKKIEYKIALDNLFEYFLSFVEDKKYN